MCSVGKTFASRLVTHIRRLGVLMQSRVALLLSERLRVLHADYHAAAGGVAGRQLLPLVTRYLGALIYKGAALGHTIHVSVCHARLHTGTLLRTRSSGNTRHGGECK